LFRRTMHPTVWQRVPRAPSPRRCNRRQWPQERGAPRTFAKCAGRATSPTTAGLGWSKRSGRVAFCQSKARKTRPALDALLHFLTGGAVMSPDSDISILLAGYRSPWLPSRRVGNLSIARALEQHRIAVAHESVAMLDRVHVRASNRVMAAERAGQHQQRGSRQMEIRQQAIDDPKAITGRNEQRSFRRAGMNVARVIGGRLDRPQARRADRNDASAARARGVDG